VNLTREHEKFPLKDSSIVVAEAATGSSIGAAAIPGMIVTVSIGNLIQPSTGSPDRALMRGATSVIYRPTEGWALDQDLQFASRASEDVIAKMRTSALTMEEALSVATMIRGLKHVNPMLGVIAAYLYDAIGDRDSIRRIAWFYATAPESFIPFDVALLADLKGERREDGRLRVRVPAVPQSAPRTPSEEQHPEYFCATEEVGDTLVAGGFPWLRQGWALLDVVSLPVHPGLVELASALLPFPFSTLEPDAGRILADLVRKGEV
jgi:hypothetical protein